MDSSKGRFELNRNHFWLALFLLAGTEIMATSLIADARGVLMNTASAKIFFYAGDGLKLLIASAAIFMLLLSKDLKSVDAVLAKGTTRSRYYWSVPVHLICFVSFLSFTKILFNGVFEASNLHFSLWTVLVILTAFSFALITAPLYNLIQFLSDQKIAILVSIGGGIVVLLISLYSRVLWEPLSNFTLHGSYLILSGIYNDLFIHPPNKLLGAKEFIVHISPQCSGIDGIALATGITSAYMYLSRHDLRFPKAILLIPIAAILALLFNLIRVAMLIAIGASISPEIAVEGFHSVSGWIGSVLIAMLIIFVFSSWPIFQKKHEAKKPVIHHDHDESYLATAILIPFILFLAATLVARIFNGGFDYLYPVKLAISSIALILFWPKYQLVALSRLYEPLLIGLVVATLWIFLVPATPDTNQAFQANLLAMPLWAMMMWLAFRMLGHWVFVPVVEELVFRCYLLNRISGQALSTRGHVSFSVIGFVVSSILFGLIHEHWIAGFVAGALFAVARYRSNSMTAPILAHASANIFISIWAIATQNWALI